MKSHVLARRALDQRLSALRGSEALARPPRGWVKAVREALGMTTGQFAARLGVSQPRIPALEKAETEGRITLNSLREAAQAMNCTLVYALVPNQPLEAMIEARAAAVAERRLAAGGDGGAVEDRGLTAYGLVTERERLIDELLCGNPKRLWDEQ
ncbi:mobile mystery protein A [Oleomonas cavernae]|uniref:Mobile mystery protein A n=1 Tax=Oleomonas cavernae TaxID=2320859 RepID=A0A418WIX2_9PROT|nr:mobile mystery protein A [Oleomonas cavernae]RJF90006.1 mobile mystery protein A [Oleomonas cavernae]